MEKNQKSLNGATFGAGTGFTYTCLLGPLLVADWKHLTGLSTAGGIERLFDGDLFSKRDHGQIKYPCAISRFARGKSLPSTRRLKELSHDDYLTRVPRSLLTSVLSQFGSPSERARQISVINAFRGTLKPKSDYFSGPLSRTIYISRDELSNPSKRTIRRLVRIGDIQSLAYLLNALPRNAGPDNKAWLRLLVEAIRDVSTRLCAFPPFYDVRHQMLGFIEHRCLAPLGIAASPDRELQVEKLRAVVMNLGRLRLVKHSFPKQMAITYWAQEVGLDAVLEESENVLAASVPRFLLPSSPLEQLLKHLRHSKTRKAKPVELRKVPKDEFELANAFDILAEPSEEYFEYLRRPQTKDDTSHRAFRRKIHRTKIEDPPKQNPKPTKRPRGWFLSSVSQRDVYADTKPRRPILHIPAKPSGTSSSVVREKRSRTIYLPASTDQHRFHQEGCPALAGFTAQDSPVQVSRLTGFCTHSWRTANRARFPF